MSADAGWNSGLVGRYVLLFDDTGALDRQGFVRAVVADRFALVQFLASDGRFVHSAMFPLEAFCFTRHRAPGSFMIFEDEALARNYVKSNNDVLSKPYGSSCVSH